MDRYEIAILADDYETKRTVWRTHAMRNTPLDWEKRRDAMIAYHIAEAEMIDAWKSLERAKMDLK